MTSYQRIVNALNGVESDRTPIMLHNFLMAAKEAGFTQAEYRNDPKKIAQSFIHAVEKYGYDGIVVDMDTVTLAGAVGVPVDLPEDDPARSHVGMLENLQDVEKLKKVNIENDKRVMILLESVRILKDYYKDELFIRGNCDQAPFSLASSMRSLQNWMMDLMDEDNQDMVFHLLEYSMDVSKQMIGLMAETGADMISQGDSPAGPAMISPAMYRKYAQPYEKRCVEEAHKKGLPYLLHICGNTTLILEDMVKTNADAIELDYLTDIHEVYRICHDKTCFVGNIDPSGILAMNTMEMVKKTTKELTSTYKDSHRFILNAGCAIPRTTPSENLAAMIDVVKR